MVRSERASWTPLLGRSTGLLGGLVLGVILAVLLAGCGGGDSTESATFSPEASVAPATPAQVASPTVRATLAAVASPRPGTPAATPNAAGLAVELLPVLTGLDRPLYVTHAGDGSGDLYVVEKGGRIRLARNGAVRDEPFLDITERVRSSGSEQGLLGLAFHPNFTRTGYLYVHYNDLNGDTVIERYTAPGDRRAADPASGKLLLAVDQPFANHNGGQILFGPDGMLWIGLGDGGSGGDPQGHGQNIGTLLGSILRIDVDSGDPYGIPPDNPFVNQAGARPEIWAYGLRNPWRFSFDRATGDLYIGDVGQNAWEEIDYLPAGSKPGANFGWNRMEATHCYPANAQCDPSGYVLPIAEYQTSREGCAVTGGYVYRGSRFPSLRGVYFFTDYCSGTLWALTRDGQAGSATTWKRTELIPARTAGFAGFSSFGEDEAGEIYVTGLSDGTVYQLVAR